MSRPRRTRSGPSRSRAPCATGGIRTAPITYLSEGEVWRAPDELAATIAADLPEALVCYDDKLALALMDALRSLGIHVPRDVGIVGFDGIPSPGSPTRA